MEHSSVGIGSARRQVVGVRVRVRVETFAVGPGSGRPFRPDNPTTRLNTNGETINLSSHDKHLNKCARTHMLALFVGQSCCVCVCVTRSPAAASPCFARITVLFEHT